MTFSQDNDPKRSQNSHSFSLKQKGLGWVPDVPERRDYSLSSQEIRDQTRLKRSKDTEWMESVGENLIQALESIINIPHLDNKDKHKLEDLASELKAKVFGNITFEYIKPNKVFKKNMPSHPDVITLKIYLSTLGYRGFFKIEGVDFVHYPKGSSLPSFKDTDSHATWFANWIISNEYREDTEELVKCFQKDVGLLDLGIVSMATHIAIQECLNYPKSPADGNFCNFLNELKTKIDQIELVAIPATLSSSFLETFFEELRRIAIQQIDQIKGQDWQEINMLLNDFVEVEALNKALKGDIKIYELNIFKDLFKLNEIFEESELKSFADSRIAEKILENIDRIFLENGLQALSAKPSLRDEEKKNEYEKFRNFIEFEYFVIEPIFSFILKVISPLALHQNDIQSLVLKAVEVLKKIVLDEPDAFGKIIHEVYNNAELEELLDFNFTKKSLTTFRNRFYRAGLSAVIKDRRVAADKKSFDLKLCFYFLLCKLVKALSKEPDALPIDADPVPELMKTEFFRFFESDPDEQKETPKDKKKGTQKSDKPKPSLFSYPTLVLPISNTFYDSSVRSKNNSYFYLPASVDLSYWCSAIEDQGKLNTCSSFAGITLLEYFTKRSTGSYVDVSPLFLYKAARDLMQVSGDRGASLRETMKAMEKFGVPPDQYWPYLPDKVDETPPQFCYSFAQNFQALKYFRLDYAGISEETLLFQIKAVLAAGFPCAFGFALYDSADDEENVRRGWIPYPKQNERLIGGHAVVAVGYSDFESVGQEGKENRPGAFLIRNSWGKDWGRGGYGWLPYDYVSQGLTADWWSLLKASWFEQEAFGLGTSDPGGVYPFVKG